MSPLIVSAVPVAADQVHLDNGDRISGEVVSVEEGAVVIDTDYSGPLSIAADRVVRLESEDEDISLRWDSLRERRASPPEAEGESSTPGEEAEATEGEAESPWSGSLEVGFAAVDAARSRQEYLVDMENAWTVEDDRLDLDVDIRHERARGNTLVDRQRVGTAYNRYLTDRLFLAPGLQYRRDSVADLERRITAVMQAGYDVFNSKEQSLTVQAGPGYRREKIEDEEVYQDLLAVWDARYERRLSSLVEGVSFFHEQSGATDVYGETGRLLLKWRRVCAIRSSAIFIWPVLRNSTSTATRGARRITWNAP
ncbi:DUF481 domain-containing protein [Fodinicurvata halophila]|uniref:DUF481 domain-containing protein n=1 Tax=Fodinicurvata halophila TaxID=1419723 RepID=UPI00363567EF